MKDSASGSTAITALQSVAFQIQIDHALQDKLRELNGVHPSRRKGEVVLPFTDRLPRTEINYGESKMTEINKAAETADRLKRFRKDWNADLDALNGKLDGLEAKKRDVSTRAHASVDGMHSQVDGFDTEITTLSNSL